MRGPGIVPADPGTPALRTARQKFDQLVLDVVTPLDERWQRHLGLVEYAVEDAPMLPDDWGDETVPLSSLVRGKGQDLASLYKTLNESMMAVDDGRVLVLPPPPIQGIGNAAGFTMQIELRDGSSAAWASWRV